MSPKMKSAHTFLSSFSPREVSEIDVDEIPEAMEAAVVLCEVVRPLPLKSKWRLVRHGEYIRVVCGV
jgi:hypothetical protein